MIRKMLYPKTLEEIKPLQNLVFWAPDFQAAKALSQPVSSNIQVPFVLHPGTVLTFENGTQLIHFVIEPTSNGALNLQYLRFGLDTIWAAAAASSNPDEVYNIVQVLTDSLNILGGAYPSPLYKALNGSNLKMDQHILPDTPEDGTPYPTARLCLTFNMGRCPVQGPTYRSFHHWRNAK